MTASGRTNRVSPAPFSGVPDAALAEARRGRRFRFGRNWQAFLGSFSDERVAAAEQSLQRFLGREHLQGCRFLDVGCGSGLFSLAARRLGASVHSFDFDPDSVACTRQLKDRFFPGDTEWTIEQGSALDPQYLGRLPRFDVVYAWGVLHHTGRMWDAIDLVAHRVAPGGLLWLALYNDQGWRSRFWLRIKQIWCSGLPGRTLVWTTFVPAFAVTYAALSLARRKNIFREYKRERGMSLYRDWIDWLGGLPFEVASPDAVRAFLEDRGFELLREKLTRRLGNNEYLFRRRTD